ncbi:MAG: hypothetical protein LC794_04410 [Acidobacteria bacterium]|nr:hypothetical protein [Acidobacteriota bacterium]
MNPALFIKITRLLLAVSVSVWLAGGCLFGCGNMSATAAEAAPSSASAAGDENCRAAQAHSCCTRPGAAKQNNAQKNAQKAKAKTNLRLTKEQLAAFPSGTLTAPPHGMKDCPLLANNTAATSKSSGSQPDPGRTPVAALPSVESLKEQTRVTIASSYVPNRGPTHLRCCVFLI